MKAYGMVSLNVKIREAKLSRIPTNTDKNNFQKKLIFFIIPVITSYSIHYTKLYDVVKAPALDHKAWDDAMENGPVIESPVDIAA